MKVLVAGFGPFPRVPRNPSGDLARALERVRRPGLANAEIHAFVFPTVYAAVARTLPRIMDKLKPDAVLLFGLAGGRELRVETRAANAASAIHPDAARTLPRSRALLKKAPRELRVRAPVRRLLAAARSAGVAARLSRDAGRYVCNASLFLCLDTVRRRKRPPLVTFIHIPPPARRAPRRVGAGRPAMSALIRAGAAILNALVAEARR
jgi:pyroglutamyl-peptidase